MDQKFQTSFIPKNPIVSGRSTKAGISLFLLVSLIIFFITVGIAIFIFLEKKVLIQNITSEEAVINTNKSSFDTNTIDNIVELNSRIIVANQLLASHISISPIFNFLQQVTLKNVRFTNFSFSVGGTDASGKPAVSVQMSGLARDWETVASQEDEFDLPDWKNIVSQPQISNLSLNADGSVSFLFTASINPQFLTYTARQTGQTSASSTTS